MPRIENRSLYEKALSIIRRLYGPEAAFRDGQYEAIEAVMSRRRTLVVQRTGWGKSLVYFACTKLMREQNRGVTMVVSPLLVLMQNQFEAAEKLGLCCAEPPDKGPAGGHPACPGDRQAGSREPLNKPSTAEQRIFCSLSAVWKIGNT